MQLPKSIKTVCVYCGSSSGNDPVYVDTAKKVGKLLAINGYDLVYGGAAIGVMTAVADAVMEHGRNVTGIIPHGLFAREVAHEGITKLLVVDSMHERKSMMAEMADVLITLPGGYGTLEELFEMITWNQIRIHDKPIFILNVNGFYDRLFGFLDFVANEGFIRNGDRTLFDVVETPELLIESINQLQGKHQDTTIISP